MIDQIQRVCQAPAIVSETIDQAQKQLREQSTEQADESESLRHDLRRWHSELRALVGLPLRGDDPSSHRLADLQERIATAERRLIELRERPAIHGAVDADPIACALRDFMPIWSALHPREQQRMLRLLVARVDYDGGRGALSITFQPDCPAALVGSIDSEVSG